MARHLGGGVSGGRGSDPLTRLAGSARRLLPAFWLIRAASRGSRVPRSRTARRCDTRTPCHSADRRRGRRRARGRLGGRRDPARRLGVELAELLQLRGTVPRQQLDAHLRRHLERVALGLVLLARVERLAVEAQAAATGRALGGAVAEDVPVRPRGPCAITSGSPPVCSIRPSDTSAEGLASSWPAPTPSRRRDAGACSAGIGASGSGAAGPLLEVSSQSLAA